MELTGLYHELGGFLQFQRRGKSEAPPWCQTGDLVSQWSLTGQGMREAHSEQLPHSRQRVEAARTALPVKESQSIVEPK